MEILSTIGGVIILLILFKFQDDIHKALNDIKEIKGDIEEINRKLEEQERH